MGLLTNLPLIGIALSAALVLLMRDWRVSFSALLVNYMCLTMFLAQQQLLVTPATGAMLGTGTIVAVKLITGLAVTAILTLTALTFSREYGLEDLDEFGLSDCGALPVLRNVSVQRRQPASMTILCPSGRWCWHCLLASPSR